MRNDQHARRAEQSGFLRTHRIAASGVVAVVLASALFAQAQITIPTVPVGNAGNAPDTAAHSGNPAGQGAVNYQYNMGKYEVTAGQYAAFLNAVAAVDTYALYNSFMWTDTMGCQIKQSGSSGSYTYSVTAEYANRPVTHVSFGDAMRFANWLHNGQPTGSQNLSTTEDGAYFLNGIVGNSALLGVTRKAGATWVVPSEDEWYKAAYYNPATGTYYLYPTSSNSAPGRSLADASGNNANYYGTPYPIDGAYWRTVVGEFQNSDSPYGTFDQGGNLMEWNEAIIPDTFRGLRGGSIIDLVSALQSSSRNSYANPIGESNAIGFRVAEVPEPGSLGLLALATLGFLMRQRRSC